MKFSNKVLFSKYNQIRRKLWYSMLISAGTEAKIGNKEVLQLFLRYYFTRHWS